MSSCVGTTVAVIDDDQSLMLMPPSNAPWLRAMLSDESYETIMNASDLVLGAPLKTGCVLMTTATTGKTALTPDHLFTALLRHNLLHDMVCLYHPPTKAVLNAYHLGSETCGHPGIIHGGLTSSVMDDSFGILVYMLKRSGVVEQGPAFTAHLEVDFRAV